LKCTDSFRPAQDECLVDPIRLEPVRGFEGLVGYGYPDSAILIRRALTDQRGEQYMSADGLRILTHGLLDCQQQNW